MIVNYHIMTGDELKRIWRLSELKQPQFCERVGLRELHELQTQFSRRNKPIDQKIEDAVNNDPELAVHKLVIVKGQELSLEKKPPREEREPDDVVKILTDTLQVMRDVLIKADQRADITDKSIIALTASNEHIIEEANLYKRIVSDGYDKGLLQWTGQKPKKTG